MALLACSALAEAAEEQKGKNGTRVMGEVVVTATRTETPVDKAGGSTFTVITAEELEAKRVVTVTEALKAVPGVDVKGNGGIGSRANVFIRGADSKNTLVLIDGIMFNDPSDPNRGADLSNLTLDNIERIEVVRGPLSTLYGTNATAGVVNIITKKGKGAPGVYAGVEGGSYNTWKAYGGTSGSFDRYNFSLTASHTDTEGFSAADADNDRIPHNGNTSEADGWENTTLSGRFGVDITPDFDVNAVFRHIDSNVKLDDYDYLGGYAGDRFNVVGFVPVPAPNGAKEANSDAKQFFGKIDVHNFFLDRFLESKFYLQKGVQKRKVFDNDAVAINDYDSTTQEAGWQGGLNFSDTNLVSFGANFFKETFETETSNEKKADVTSFWIQDQIYLGDFFILDASARTDRHDAFGNKVTYRIAPAYTLSPTETVVKASYGTGFRSPSLYELFADPNPLVFFAGGNPNLQPETSDGWDVGVEQPVLDGQVKFGVTYFALNLDDRIAYDFATGSYVNDTGKTKTAGIESFIQWVSEKDLDLVLNYTHTGAHDPNGDRLIYRPQNKVQFNARYRFMEKALVNLEILWVDERDTGSFDLDKDGNPVGKLDAYTLVNLSGQYDLTRNLQVYGRLENLLDTFYEESWSYAMPGFSAYAGLKLSF